MANITTAHVRYTVDNAGQAATITAVGRFKAGAVTAIALTDPINPTESVHIVIIGQSIYLQLPASLNHFGKPWVLATPHSSDPLIQGLSSISSAKDATSIVSVLGYVQAGQSVRNDGASDLNGVAGTKYSVLVDVAKLPSNPDNQPLIGSGLKTLPMDIWIDAQGRVLRVHETYTVQGQNIDMDIAYSKFNTPATITAPPSDQVAVS
jgi:hypothetical protein